VVAKVAATNSFGTGIESDVNEAGALIETVPHKPDSSPTRGPQTHESQIHLEFEPLVGV